MASRSRCHGRILGERHRPTCTGTLFGRLVEPLSGVMIDLPTVGRLQMPDEQLADEVSELFPLNGGQLVPKWRSRLAPHQLLLRRGGTCTGMSLRMKVLLAVWLELLTIGPVQAEP